MYSYNIYPETGLCSLFLLLSLTLPYSFYRTHMCICAHYFSLGQLLWPRFCRVTPKRTHIYRGSVWYSPPPPIKEEKKYGTRTFEYASTCVADSYYHIICPEYDVLIYQLHTYALIYYARIIHRLGEEGGGRRKKNTVKSKNQYSQSGAGDARLSLET